MSLHKEHMKRAKPAIKLGLATEWSEPGAWLQTQAMGTFICEMKDAATGEVLLYWEKKNTITRDAGILAARLFKNSQSPNPGQNNGLTMLAVGTGATGNILSPDAAQPTQRKLNNEIARKAFVSSQYRNSDGVAVSYPTNILDFTTTFGEAEAVGPLNEMGLMCTYSLNPSVRNVIENGPSDYDDTIDVTGKDLMVNYLTFGVISKPSTAIVTFTWRLTF